MRSSVLLRGTASDVLRDSTARRHSHSNLLRGLARDLLRGRAVLLLVSSCERGKLRALLLPCHERASFVFKVPSRLMKVPVTMNCPAAVDAAPPRRVPHHAVAQIAWRWLSVLQWAVILLW